MYGVYCGLNLQNIFSLTTQMPNTIEIVTNNESMRCRNIILDGRKIIIRKSRCQINCKNVQAYTILQLLSDIKDNEKIDDRAKNSIFKYIKENNISNNDLTSLVKYFPAQTSKK